MNYYFLLEDEKSFLKVLPLWLEYMGFRCTRVADIMEVNEDNYVLQSGQGVTQLITKALFDTINTIIANPGKIDKLIVILDAEEIDCDSRKTQVQEQIAQHYQEEEITFDIETLVCNHCFETWLLGCCGLYPQTTVDEKSDFYPYYIHYNIEENDPEYMAVPQQNMDTIAKYHFHYLHELLRYKKIRYSKSRPQNVATENYFHGLVQRINTTNHLQSFETFYHFILAENER